ncbi:uncharacterized protein LOC135848593 isoform X2 [Planococcus citri]|uniref:uncharacterized protein LOC135848593 isoform X2 n=1 Tax=Planococcus citri TaxID=170843 RepID=UPI0031F72C87
MKILLLLVWSGSIFKLITGELAHYQGHYVASNLRDIIAIDEASKDFCAMHNQLTNTPMISIDDDFIRSPRCKRDADSSRDRKSGGLFRNRDNDHNRFENRGRNDRKPQEDRNNDRRPNRGRDDGDRRSFGGRGNDRGANRGPNRDRDGGDRRSFGGRGGNQGQNQAPFRGRDGGDQGDRRSFGGRGNDRGPNRGPYRGNGGGDQGNQRSYGGRGDDRRSFGGQGNDRRSFGGRDDNRRSFGGRDDNRRSFGGRDNNRRSFGGQGEDRRSYGDRDGNRRSFGNQDGGQRAYGDRGGNQRSYGDRGGNQRSYGDRGGNQRSYGDRGDNRRSFGDRNDNRKPYRNQNDDRQSYNNRDRGGYGREDRQQRSYDRNDQQPNRNRDTRNQFSKKFTFAEDSMEVALQKRGRTSKFGGINITKFRILKITNRTKKGFDLKGTVTMNLDESYFEYSDSATKKPSKKVTSESDTDYSIKGANLSPSIETLEENTQAKHSTTADAHVSKQKAKSSTSVSEEYSQNDQSAYSEEYSEDDESGSYDSKTMTDSQESSKNGDSKDSDPEATAVSEEYSESDQPTSYETDSSKHDKSQKTDSELKNYDTEDDYTEDETPFKQESEYSDEVKTMEQKTLKGQITTKSQKSQHSKLKTLAKDPTVKSSATENLKTSEQIATKPTTRNLQHRTPKHVTKPPAKTPDSIEKDTFENYKDFQLQDNKDKNWSFYQKRAEKYKSFIKHDFNETSIILKPDKIESTAENQDPSFYENSGDYIDSDSDEHDHTGEQSESQEEESSTHTSPLQNHHSKTSVKSISTTRLKPIGKASSYEEAYKDSHSEEESKTYKTLSLKQTPPSIKLKQTASKGKQHSKTMPKTNSKKGHKISASDSAYSQDEDSYAHEYTEEVLGKGKNNAQQQSQNDESASFYDDSNVPELTEDQRNKLTSQLNFFKDKVYVYNTKLQDYEFIHASEFKKLNISKDMAFGNTERLDGEKKRTKSHGLTKTLNPIIQQQLNKTSIEWPVFTTTVIPTRPRHRFSSRPHPPRKAYHDKSPRSRRVRPPK